MKGMFKVLAFGALLATLTLAALPSHAAAWEPFGNNSTTGDYCSSAPSSAVCKDRNQANDPVSGSHGLIMKVVDIIAFVGGAVAVVILILAGMRFVTSAGNSDDVAGARRSIIYASVGLIVIALSRTIVAFIIGKL